MLGKKIFEGLIAKSQEVMGQLTDKRLESNAKRYSMQSVGMGGLSIFLMQDPSFLSHQERLAKGSSNHNFRSLFGCETIPTPNQIRNLLDPVNAAEFEPLYDNGLKVLEEHGGLRTFEYLKGGFLIALDGVEFQSSDRIHCKNCTVKVHKDKDGNEKAKYSHSMLAASIVSPEVKEAVALVPEFIVPQDGRQKQDCENAAMKRWLSKHSERYKNLNPTLLGDDLFSRQPICEEMLKAGFHFILTCKPLSHKTLYEYVLGVSLEKTELELKKRNKTYRYQYNFINQVPIRDGDGALLVNWLEVREIDKKTGKVLYKNSFITDHPVGPETVHRLAMAGRSRWRIENENNNTLKTKGYRFEHNYGHGKKNLSMVFASLAVIAFLYHTVLNIVDLMYMKAKEAQGPRINFFNMIKAVTSILVFKSWSSLMAFLSNPPDPFSLGEF